MKTKKILTVSTCLVLLTSALYAQMPSVPQVDKSATQVQQTTNQANQTANQQAQNAKQSGNKLQQTATNTASSSSSFMKKAEEEVSKISAKVNDLSPDQKEKLKQLYVDYFTKKAQNKATAAGNADQLKQLNTDANKTKKEGIKSILTPAQFATLKQAAKNKASTITK